MSEPGRPWLVCVVLACLFASVPVHAQQVVETRVTENFRREPQGQILGRLGSGTPLLHVSSQSSWTEAALEGWVWTASLRTTEREGFALVVSAPGGENVRAAPSGRILGHLEEGTLLEELGREPGWTRVRRTGWIWSASVTTRGGSAVTEPEPTAAATDVVAGTRAGPAVGQFVRLGERTPILSSPDGDTLGFSTGSGDVALLAREGSWARVRLDGWVWRPVATEGEVPEEADDASGGVVTPDRLTAPGGESLEGRRVTWRIQYISLERAEAIRTDFFEGEPFLLGRFQDGSGPFVYIAVPPERLTEVQGLTPLELVTITGRVRRASSALTDTPIVELLAVVRGSGR